MLNSFVDGTNVMSQDLCFFYPISIFFRSTDHQGFNRSIRGCRTGFFEVLSSYFHKSHEQIELPVAPIKEMEFPGMFIENLRSWFVTLECPPSNKDRVSTGSGKSEKVRKFFRGSGKSQGRKFLSMQIFNFNKKVICTQKCVQLNCI